MLSFIDLTLVRRNMKGLILKGKKIGIEVLRTLAYLKLIFLMLKAILILKDFQKRSGTFLQ